MDGHEIGTHFNGHFCAGTGPSRTGRPPSGRSEIEQAVSFVKTLAHQHRLARRPAPCRSTTRRNSSAAARPCLLGQDNLLPTARELGWRYDATLPGRSSRPGPSEGQGLWDLPLQAVPFPGHTFEVLSMDYNFLANQSGNSTRGPRANYPGLAQQATESYTAGFAARRTTTNPARRSSSATTSRHWNGGIYMDAVEESLKHIARQEATYASSPSGSSSTGSTCRARRSSPGSAPWRSDRLPPVAGTTSSEPADPTSDQPGRPSPG